MDKESWLAELGAVILESNQHLWANEGQEWDSLLPGFHTLIWKKPGTTWEVVDQFAGHFRAPGFTVVYWKGQPVWTNAYAGRGQEPNHYPEAGETFAFLREALKANVNPKTPFRGPGIYDAEGWQYSCDTAGTIEEGYWNESIFKIAGGKSLGLVFSQHGEGGIIIGRNEEGVPLYPWDI